VIQFDLKDAAMWTISIYNVMGQRVREFSGQSTAGRMQVRWDGRSDAGMPLASGVYFYRLSANGFTDFKKMMLVK
jgi:flagellar hook assembly protein FlgD